MTGSVRNETRFNKDELVSKVYDSVWEASTIKMFGGTLEADSKKVQFFYLETFNSFLILLEPVKMTVKFACQTFRKAELFINFLKSNIYVGHLVCTGHCHGHHVINSPIGGRRVVSNLQDKKLRYRKSFVPCCNLLLP